MMRGIFGTYGLPKDYVAWAALAIGLVLLLSSLLKTGVIDSWLERARRGGTPTLRFVMSASFLAAFLSLAYVAYYLGGGPRIIDATTYFLEGRTLAQGSFTFPVLEPTASFRGRFLLFSEGNRLGAIFPPGYPLILAFGFIIGAPMVIGPLLAAAITSATYFLAKELGYELFGPSRISDIERAARAATLLSVVSAALRYHTADTMSHGAAALLLTMAFASLLFGRRTGATISFAIAGFCLGALIATRPISAIPLAMIMIVVAWREKRLVRVALWALPGIALLLASQASVAGSWLSSTQKAYYAVSDGPPGCFRYGFGEGVGCVFEHGDVVQSRLGSGYGIGGALLNTLRRLRLHLLDVTNFELVTLALAAMAAPIVKRATSRGSLRLAALLVGGQILVYLPFYFDGSYPGGGGRFYADVIPIEQALFALALVDRFGARAAKSVAITLGAASLGFALHAVHDHIALKTRDGGRPMFEPDLVRESHKDHGLIFFDSDHGFNLATQPGVTPSHGIVAVRRRNDDRDRWLYDVLGRPSTHRYVFGPDKSTLEPWTPPMSSPAGFRFETEAEWPPLAQRGGWVQPVWASGVASQDRYLQITPTAADGAEAELELLVPQEGRNTLEPFVVLEGKGAKGHLEVVSRGKVVADWDWADAPLPAGAPGPQKPQIVGQIAKTFDLAGPARLRLRTVGGPTGLDRVNLRSAR